MKKAILLSFAVLVGATLSFSGTAMAQKKHAPKPVWGAMINGLSDIQAITAALMVFDMKKVAKVAGELQGRETYISKIERLPKPVRDGHARVADAAAMVVAAAKAGEEADVVKGMTAVMNACNACHYNGRDAERRKKMK